MLRFDQKTALGLTGELQCHYYDVRQDDSGLDIGYSRQPFFNASFEAKHHKTTRKHATFGPEIVQKTHLNYGHHLQSKPLTQLQTGNSATAIKFTCISVLTIFQSTQLNYGPSYLHRKWLKRRISSTGTLYK